MRSLQKPRAMPIPSGSTAQPEDVGSFNSRNALIHSVYDEDGMRADTPEKSQSKSDHNPYLHETFNMEPVEVADHPGTPLKADIMNVYDE